MYDYNYNSKWYRIIPIESIISFDIMGDIYTDVYSEDPEIKRLTSLESKKIHYEVSEPIRSKRVDNRKTILIFNCTGKIEKMYFPGDIHDFLMRRIPEKEMRYLNEYVQQRINPGNRYPKVYKGEIVDKGQAVFRFIDTMKEIKKLKENNPVKVKASESNNKNGDALEKIRELASLKEDGIITEEEFNEHKKILLGRI